MHILENRVEGDFSFLVRFLELFNLPIEATVFPVASVVLPIKPGVRMQATFLGAFAELQKATVGFVMSVCPTALPPAWNNSAPTGRIFMKFGTLFFFNLSREIKLH